AAVLCCLGGSLMAAGASAQQLYSNGPFITHPGAHVPSGDVSVAQDVTYPGYTALGFNAGPDFRLADDFLVPVGHIWTVTSAVLYAYQTGSADADFTDARVIIWKGAPDTLNAIKLFDGEVSNNLVSTTPGAYRTAQSFGATMFTDTARRIKSIEVAIPPLQLSGGAIGEGSQFWIDWKLKGPTPGNAVFTPPVSILGQAYTADNGFARMKCPAGITDPEDECFNVAGSWILFENGTAPYLVDLPFLINGSDLIDTILRTGFESLPTTP
ncbi:MAG TPA: hypothetical protein PLR28_09445, partial [Dokdonella sp.]|nr:hypothetical protein [Dokdonella sp.]